MHVYSQSLPDYDAVEVVSVRLPNLLMLAFNFICTAHGKYKIYYSIFVYVNNFVAIGDIIFVNYLAFIICRQFRIAFFLSFDVAAKGFLFLCFRLNTEETCLSRDLPLIMHQNEPNEHSTMKRHHGNWPFAVNGILLCSFRIENIKHTSFHKKRYFFFIFNSKSFFFVPRS